MSKKILIIDDDPLVAVTTKAGLEAAGFQFLTAGNGAEGFELAKKELPDLIVLDVMMPKENGLMTLSKIKQDEITKNIPVIVSTNLEEAYQIVKDKGVAGFILKAKSSIIELVDKIKEILKVEP